MILRAAIIGAGRIGAFLDDPQSPRILTHAHGYWASKNFEIAGFVDPIRERAESAVRRWGGVAYESIGQLLAQTAVDVVSVCVPNELHCEALLSLAETPVRLIFLEKPPVMTVAESAEARHVYGELKLPVLVNYSRRFVPEIREIAKLISRGAYGRFLSGTGYYGKGLLHNGSHLIDLLRFLLGPVDRIRKIDETIDFSADDPGVSALLSPCAGGQFLLRYTDYRLFDIFELDLIFEKRRIRICELGTAVEEYSVGPDQSFEGYTTLNQGARYSTSYTEAISYAIANIHDHLEAEAPLQCSLEESLLSVETCFEIRDSPTL